MKKTLLFLVALAMLLTAIPTSFAMNFTGELGNEATFETLQEAHANAPAIVHDIAENGASTFVGHPALEGYPENTTFVYRSPNLYAGRASARLNSNIFVYTDQHFASKDEAFAFLADAGLTDIMDEAIGSIVLVTPIGKDFAQADAAAYYALQTAMFAQKAGGVDAEGKRVRYADAEYFGGFSYIYFVGIDGGATFFHNYIAPEIDFAGRIAGALLIGGSMQKIRKPSIYVPVYLVNTKDEIIEKYKEINGVTAKRIDGALTTWTNQAWPLRRVDVDATETPALKDVVKAAYYGMFVKAMRIPVLLQAIYSAGTPFSGYNFDQAPYSLCDRNILIDNKTEDGIYLIEVHGDDRFAEIKDENGEYIDAWYEYLPEEVLNNTAPAGTIPLVLGNHGGGDDPRAFVEEFGLLELAGKERFAIIAPDHQNIEELMRGPTLTATVRYMLEKYPALDASRVYATGYSMGGGASYTVGYYDPQLFAAVAPIAGRIMPLPEHLADHFYEVELPIFFGLSSFDGLRGRMDAVEGNISEDERTMISIWAKNNGITPPEFDFETYPNLGYGGDFSIEDRVNDEFDRITVYLENDAGEPRVGFTYLEGTIHALYPEYSTMMWDFVKMYSRDQETGAVVYNPFAK